MSFRGRRKSPIGGRLCEEFCILSNTFYVLLMSSLRFGRKFLRLILGWGDNTFYIPLTSTLHPPIRHKDFISILRPL